MNAIRWRDVAHVLALGACVLLTGCMSPAMRGTTFYTDEYGKGGAAHERLNLWPAVYYRSPAFSALWPIFEKSPAYTAVRPVFSAYRENDGKSVYSVLWPLAQFDRRDGRNRIFPAYWGKGHVVVLPLYWHVDDRYGAGTSMDIMFPLWMKRSMQNGVSFDMLWPIVNVTRMTDEKGWRVWPIVGSYREEHGTASTAYRFLLWPLGHQWSGPAVGSRGSAFIPLYLANHNVQHDLFLSLPFSACDRRDGVRWQLLFPLFLRRTDANRSGIYSLLAGAGRTQGEKVSWSYAVPLYFHRRDGGDRLLVSPLVWASGTPGRHWWLAPLVLSGGSREADERQWWALAPLVHSSSGKAGVSRHAFPFFYYSRDARSRLLVTLPLVWGGESERNYSWLAPLLLSGGSREADERQWWALAPLVHSSSGKAGVSRHAIPFFYYSRDAERRLLLTLPWSSGVSGDEHWQLAFPLYLRQVDRTGDRLFTPLYARGLEPDGTLRWQSLMPLGVRWTDGKDRRNVLVPPALTWFRSVPNRRDLWALAGMAHASWGSERGSSHVFPLYYRKPGKAWVTPFAARWTDRAGRESSMVPPALTWWRQTPGRGDLWALGGLGHASWGPERGSSHVFPLYYRKPGKAWVTPLAARWTDRTGRESAMVLPALTWWRQTPGRGGDLWALGGLGHASWGPERGSSYVFPLFYRNPGKTFLTPLFGKVETQGRQSTVVPLLLSRYVRTGDSKRVDALLGLGSERWGEGRRSGYFFPLYLYEDGARTFYSLLFGWSRDNGEGFVYPLTPVIGFRTGRHRGGWFFPLFSRDRDTSSGVTRGSILWGTYRREGRTFSSWLFPFYSYENLGPMGGSSPSGGGVREAGRTFWCLPACWYRNTETLRREGGGVARVTVKRSGFVPFWVHKRETSAARSEARTWVVGLLYDRLQRKVAGRTAAADEDYLRHRVLWRAWHYERLNGDVSIDLFPGITYDRTPGGARSFSFLWRLFRYERMPAGVKLHVLFIPIKR